MAASFCTDNQGDKIEPILTQVSAWLKEAYEAKIKLTIHENVLREKAISHIVQTDQKTLDEYLQIRTQCIDDVTVNDIMADENFPAFIVNIINLDNLINTFANTLCGLNLSDSDKMRLNYDPLLNNNDFSRSGSRILASVRRCFIYDVNTRERVTLTKSSSENIIEKASQYIEHGMPSALAEYLNAWKSFLLKLAKKEGHDIKGLINTVMNIYGGISSYVRRMEKLSTALEENFSIEYDVKYEGDNDIAKMIPELIKAFYVKRIKLVSSENSLKDVISFATDYVKQGTQVALSKYLTARRDIFASVKDNNTAIKIAVDGVRDIDDLINGCIDTVESAQETVLGVEFPSFNKCDNKGKIGSLTNLVPFLNTSIDEIKLSDVGDELEGALNKIKQRSLWPSQYNQLLKSFEELVAKMKEVRLQNHQESIKHLKTLENAAIGYLKEIVNHLNLNKKNGEVSIEALNAIAETKGKRETKMKVLFLKQCAFNYFVDPKECNRDDYHKQLFATANIPTAYIAVRQIHNVMQAYEAKKQKRYEQYLTAHRGYNNVVKNTPLPTPLKQIAFKVSTTALMTITPPCLGAAIFVGLALGAGIMLGPVGIAALALCCLTVGLTGGILAYYSSSKLAPRFFDDPSKSLTQFSLDVSQETLAVAKEVAGERIVIPSLGMAI